MNKSVLIVTPYFAPQSHAAVFRAYKLAKYLPRFGWKPYVLTTDSNYLYNEDPGLLEALPREVEIIRARYIEPTLRGVRMALGGRNRTFRALKGNGDVPRGAIVDESAARSRPLRRFYAWALGHWIEVPDAYRTWYRPALAQARSLASQKKIELVYTTCLPYTCNLIGRQMQQGGCRWIADFRDPAGCASRVCSPVESVYLMQRRIVRDTLIHADAVTTLASTYGPIFMDSYGLHNADSIHFIPTGLDEDLVAPQAETPSRPFPYLIFQGEFLPEYSRSFFEVFSEALADQRLKDSGLKLLVVGHLQLNQSRVGPALRSLALDRYVEFVDHVPQGDLYNLIRNAVAGVLVPGPSTLWWTNFAKMVDYIALRKPVLAMVPDPSEARTQLIRTRLGVFLDGDTTQCAKSLVDVVTGRIGLPNPYDAECERYTARRQVEAFVEVFESLLSDGRRTDAR